MAARATAEVNGDTLALSGVLDFESVLAIDVEGRRWLQGVAPSVCNINLGAISYSSSAGIALLLGWLRVALQQKKKLHIVQLPADMAALARVGGLEDLLAGV